MSSAISVVAYTPGNPIKSEVFMSTAEKSEAIRESGNKPEPSGKWIVTSAAAPHYIFFLISTIGILRHVDASCHYARNTMKQSGLIRSQRKYEISEIWRLEQALERGRDSADNLGFRELFMQWKIYDDLRVATNQKYKVEPIYQQRQESEKT